MKLFQLPVSVIDARQRAQWLTPIFDLSFKGAPVRLLSAWASVNTSFSAWASNQ